MKLFCLILILFGSLHLAFDSNVQDYLPKIHTPSSSSLIHAIEYPVEYRTNIPKIDIRLFETMIENKQFSISLNFHAATYLKVNQQSGKVGNGWSISSDLEITRSINGMDDLIGYGYLNNPDILHWTQNSNNGHYRDAEYLTDMYLGVKDELPDKFYYKLLDKAGVFYFSKSGNGEIIPLEVPLTGVKISYNKTNRTFNIRNTDGLEYEFGGDKGDRVEVLGSNRQTTISWKCVEIRFPSGKRIVFSYKAPYKKGTIDEFGGGRYEIHDDIINKADSDPILQSGPFPSANYCNSSVSLNDIPFWKIGSPKWKGYGGYSSELRVANEWGDFSSGLQDRDYYVGGAPDRSMIDMYITDVSEIKLPNGIINFTYGSNAQLENISIKNIFNETISNIGFLQHTDPKYNRLDQLNIDDKKYNFEYGRQPLIGVVPLFGNYKGYPAGNAIEAAVPQQTIDLRVPSINLDTRPLNFYNCMRIDSFLLHTTIGSNSWQYPESEFLLLKVGLPTEGRTEFYMEQNKYKDKVGINPTIEIAPGYRIHKIVNYPDASNAVSSIKRYKYGKDEDGGGQMYCEPVFSGDNWNQNTFTEQRVETYYANSYGAASHLLITERKRTFANRTINKMEYDDGAPVNYGTVTEYAETADGRNNGKTIFYYNLEEFVAPYSSSIDPFPVATEEWNKGFLDSVVYLKKNLINNMYEKDMKTSYKYKVEYLPQQIFQRRTWMTVIPECIDCSNLVLREFYKTFAQYSYRFNGLKTGRVNVVLNVTNYNFAAHQTAIIKTMNFRDPLAGLNTDVNDTTSNGAVKKTISVYTNDFSSGGNLGLLKSQNTIDLLIEKIVIQGGKVIAGTLFEYNNVGKLIGIKEINDNNILSNVFKISNLAQTGVDVAYVKGTYSPDARYRPITMMTYYTDYNIQQVTNLGGAISTYLWGYGGQYPIAEIRNATYSEVATVLTQSAIDNLNVATHSEAMMETLIKNAAAKLRNALPQAMVSSYTYRPLVGMTSKTDARGITEYYKYDGMQRLQAILDHLNYVNKSFDYHYRPN